MKTPDRPLASWPSREEWAAQAAHYARTVCDAHERVPAEAAHWLTDTELSDLYARLDEVVKHTRHILNRTAREAGGATRDVRSDRTTLNGGAREARKANVNDVVIGVRDVLNAAGRRLPAADPDPAQLSSLVTALRTRRDLAAREAVEEAVRREIDTRASDSGWRAELERRARIDAASRNRLGF